MMAVVFSVGIRPCTGAILVLVFALTQGLFWAGVAATFAMALGTAITVAVLATLALGSRELALKLGGRSGACADAVWTFARLAATALILLLGRPCSRRHLGQRARFNFTPIACFGTLMAERITAYLLLLLICGSVAAEPVNEPAKTAAVHPPVAPKEVKSTPAGPANVLFGSVPGPAPIAARAIGSLREAASLEVCLFQSTAPLASDATFARPQLGSSAAVGLS